MVGFRVEASGHVRHQGVRRVVGASMYLGIKDGISVFRRIGE